MLLNQDSGFGRRLKLYLFGVILGAILSYFLVFRGRDLTFWTPENQIVGRLQNYALTFDPLVQCRMNCADITEKEFRNMLDSAVVDFKNSDPQMKPCPRYIIITKNNGKVLATLCDSTATILDWPVGNATDTCKCK